MRVGRPWSTRISQLVADANLDINGYALVTTNLMLKEYSVNYMAIRNRADTADRNLYVALLQPTLGVQMVVNGGHFSASNVDSRYAILQARDTGVALVEIARLVGAPTAYFKLIDGRTYYGDNPLHTEMLLWGLIT